MQEIFQEDLEVLLLEAVQMVRLVQEDLVVEVESAQVTAVVHQHVGRTNGASGGQEKLRYRFLRVQ